MPSVSAIAATSFAVWFASHGWSTVDPWIARSAAMSSSAICDGPSSPIETPGVRAAERERRAADRRHAHEVVRAREEGRERRRERPPADGLEPDRGGDQLLLGDVHLEVAVGMRLRERLGERRVGDLAVEGDDVRARRAERGERIAVRLSCGHLGAELVARGARAFRAPASPERSRRASATSIRTSRHPPSSAIAASGSSSGLPWKPFTFSTAATPLPFVVRATTTVGRPVVATAWPNAASIASRSWPSTRSRSSRTPRRARRTCRGPSRPSSRRAGRAG